MKKIKLICSVLAISLILTSCAAKNRNQETASNTTGNKNEVLTSNPIKTENKDTISAATTLSEPVKELPKESQKQEDTSKKLNNTQKTNSVASNININKPKETTVAPPEAKTNVSTANNVSGNSTVTSGSSTTQTTNQSQNTNNQNEVSNNTEAPKPTYKEITFYDSLGIDESKLIKDNSRFTVNYSNLNPKPKENITLKVSPLDFNSAYVESYQVYNKTVTLGGSNGYWVKDSNGNNTKVYQSLFVVQDIPADNNEITCYTFIKMKDGSVYQYINKLNLSK